MARLPAGTPQAAILGISSAIVGAEVTRPPALRAFSRRSTLPALGKGAPTAVALLYGLVEDHVSHSPWLSREVLVVDFIPEGLVTETFPLGIDEDGVPGLELGEVDEGGRGDGAGL